MAIDKQVTDKLKASGSVLIVLGPMPTPDATAAALALFKFFQKTGKKAVVVASDERLNPKIDFLPGFGSIRRELDETKSLVIEISTKRTQAKELTYQKDTGKITVFLKPRSGQFSREDVVIKQARFPYDAVIVLGADKLGDLGGFYARFAELFFETPVINIDYRSSNESFGQFNLIDLTAVSVSEIVYDLLTELDQGAVDREVATALLTGLIAETNSFQHSRTSPQSFLKASQLMAHGASQQDIVNRLYKNKSLGFLKLWGRVLAGLRHEPDLQLIYSGVAQSDLDKAGASEQEAAGVLREMVGQLNFGRIHVFFRETKPAQTEVFVSAPAALDLESVFSKYQPESTAAQYMRMKLPLGLPEAEKQVLTAIRDRANQVF